MQLTRPTWRTSVRRSGTEESPLDIWRLRLDNLDGDPLPRLHSLTVPSEHARGNRYRFEADRHRHLAGRALVRLHLAHRYECAPQDLSIRTDPHGKPRLTASPEADSAVEFNIAHTEDVVVAAFSHPHPVGIDVESQRREGDIEALAHRVFTDTEFERWHALPQARRLDAFIHVWTCKEAFLKATGAGLQRAPDTIECTFDDNIVVDVCDADGPQSAPPSTSAAQWAVRSFSVAQGIAGAVVRKHAVPAAVTWTDATQFVNRHSVS